MVHHTRHYQSVCFELENNKQYQNNKQYPEKINQLFKFVKKSLIRNELLYRSSYVCGCIAAHPSK